MQKSVRPNYQLTGICSNHYLVNTGYYSIEIRALEMNNGSVPKVTCGTVHGIIKGAIT